VVGLSNLAAAQGTNIHTCLGANGSEFLLDAATQVFNYEATVSGCSVAHVTTLEVFHNGVLKASFSQVMVAPPPAYLFAAPVDMTKWGLKAGDTVTFRLKVVRLGLFGPILATHSLTGNVVEKAPLPSPLPVEGSDPQP
jgi:hypothetical protein